jgi:hypothetical protein
MIYKNTTYNKINEDFDFGKIKGHRVEDDYQLSYGKIRTLNKKINPCQFINIQYGVKYPKRLATDKYYTDEAGEFYVPKTKNLDLLGYQEYLYWDLTDAKKPQLSLAEENRLIDAKFTNHVYSDIKWLSESVNETEIPEWFKSLIIGIYNRFDISVDFNLPIRYSYYLSPDEGIVIITTLVVNIPKEHTDYKSGARMLYPIVAYTGLISYEYNKFKDDRKEYNKIENINICINRFCKVLLKKYASLYNFDRYTKLFTPILKNNHIILYNNERQTIWLVDQLSRLKNVTCVKDLFFNNGDQCFNPYILQINDRTHLQEFKNILYKSNDDNTNTIAGYISEDGLICMYFVNDYDTLTKLIGKENADEAELVSYEIGKNLYENDSDFYTYAFWYVTDKGMKLFDLYNKRLINTKDINSGDYEDKIQ